LYFGVLLIMYLSGCLFVELGESRAQSIISNNIASEM